MKYLLVILTLCSTLFAEPAPQPTHPIVIIGGGVGALTSALYLARAGVEAIVIEGANPGGLITQSTAVQNWPGELEISGPELAEKLRKQAEASGARFLREEVIAVDFSKRPFTLTTRSLDKADEKHTLIAESAIIAMGTRPNYLGVPGEQTYWGHGVSNCAICDGTLYRNRTVGVVGGGDAAIVEGLYLSNIAKEVHLFVRKDHFKTVEQKRLDKLLAKPNIKVHYGATVQEIQGNGKDLIGVLLQEKKSTTPFSLDGLFLAIGSKPNSTLFQNILSLDSQGYIQLKKDQETSIPGVYAIGDIVDPIYKQAISAAGDGAKAALQAQQYLSDRADGLIAKKAPPISANLPALIAATTDVIEITSSEQFERELKSSDVPVFVDFYASWCGPCKRISPLIKNSAQALGGRVKFLKVNVDQLTSLSQTYQIRAMPTVILFDTEGKPIDRKVGSDEITDLLRSLQNK
ncbi:MAG: FAD-dependent oxidoreductase [Verrucomicrobiota bacterium]|nr:FAD-dependent oxidoreductase [Verrucomicrobiota bacterium]